MKQMICALTVFLFVAQAWGAKFKVVSEPAEAEVFVRQPQSLSETRVGKTPINIEMENFVANYAKGNTFVMTIKKEGYEEYRVLVGHANKSGVDLSVNLQLSKDFVISKKFDTIVGQLFEAQRLVRLRRYTDAIKIVDVLEKEYPYLSTVYEVKGSALYLNKDFSGALAYYRKAFSKNPENMDAYSMKEYLEKSLGLENKQ